jgi:hypothetical protein
MRNKAKFGRTGVCGQRQSSYVGLRRKVKCAKRTQFGAAGPPVTPIMRNEPNSWSGNGLATMYRQGYREITPHGVITNGSRLCETKPIRSPAGSKVGTAHPTQIVRNKANWPGADAGDKYFTENELWRVWRFGGREKQSQSPGDRVWRVGGRQYYARPLPAETLCETNPNCGTPPFHRLGVPVGCGLCETKPNLEGLGHMGKGGRPVGQYRRKVKCAKRTQFGVAGLSITPITRNAFVVCP